MERAFHQSAETTAHTIINNFPQLESSIDMLFSSLINNSVTMVKIENELDNWIFLQLGKKNVFLNLKI